MNAEDDHSLVITCGNVAGRLHTKLFKCPGIRVPCVEFQGGFITPKDFTYVGGKHTLKDWKTAIKCNGSSLRKLIDTGELDFYNHEELCTGRCVSRNLNVNSNFPRANPEMPSFVTGASEVSAADLDTTTTSLEDYTVLKQITEDGDEPGGMSYVTNHARLNSGGSLLHKITSVPAIKKEPGEEEEEGDAGEVVEGKQANGYKAFLVSPAAVNKHKAKASKYDVVSGQGDADFENLTESFPNIDDFLDESQQFWSSILKLGMMEPVMKEIKRALDQMWISWMGREEVNEEEATRMSHAISDLGLTQVLKVKLAEQKTSMSRQHVKLQIEIEELKRKLAESEKKQEEHNKKSEAFETLIELSNKVKSKSKKSNGGAQSKNFKVIYTEAPTILQNLSSSPVSSPKRKAGVGAGAGMDRSPGPESKRLRVVTNLDDDDEEDEYSPADSDASSNDQY